MPDRIYNMMVITENESGFVDVPKGCNGFTFTNTGDVIAEVNGMIAYPGVIGTSLGDSRSIGGNQDEIYLGNIKLSFTGAGANPAVEFAFKIYADKK